jgi:hypothetical protein
MTDDPPPTGWQPFSGKSDAAWEARADEISTRHASGNIANAEHIYLPACEVVGRYDRQKPWKLARMTKKAWIATRNPLRTFRSTTHWNNLLKLHKIRLLWPEARRDYEQQNTDWQPKHESGVLWAVDIIEDHVNGHPRELEAKVTGPKPVTGATWKARYERLRELANDYIDPALPEIAQLDAEVKQDAKSAPAELPATDDVQKRLEREAAIRQKTGGGSPNKDAMERQLALYRSLEPRAEAVDIFYRAISSDYVPAPADIARLQREIEDAEAYVAEDALPDQSDGPGEIVEDTPQPPQAQEPIITPPPASGTAAQTLADALARSAQAAADRNAERANMAGDKPGDAGQNVFTVNGQPLPATVVRKRGRPAPSITQQVLRAFDPVRVWDVAKLNRIRVDTPADRAEMDKALDQLWNPSGGEECPIEIAGDERSIGWTPNAVYIDRNGSYSKMLMSSPLAKKKPAAG